MRQTNLTFRDNATATNETGFEEVNETGAIENATDQSDIQGNATAATKLDSRKLMRPVL